MGVEQCFQSRSRKGLKQVPVPLRVPVHAHAANKGQLNSSPLASLPLGCMEVVANQLSSMELGQLRATCRELRGAVDAVAHPHVHFHLTPEVACSMKEGSAWLGSMEHGGQSPEPPPATAGALGLPRRLWQLVRLGANKMLKVGLSAPSTSNGGSSASPSAAEAQVELDSTCAYLQQNGGAGSLLLVLGPRKLSRAECAALQKAAAEAESQGQPAPGLLGGSSRATLSLTPADVAAVIHQLGAAAGGRLRSLTLICLSDKKWPAFLQSALPPFTPTILAAICSACPGLRELKVVADRAQGVPEAWAAAMAALPPQLHTLGLQLQKRWGQLAADLEAQSLMQTVVQEVARRGRVHGPRCSSCASASSVGGGSSSSSLSSLRSGSLSLGGPSGGSHSSSSCSLCSFGRSSGGGASAVSSGGGGLRRLGTGAPPRPEPLRNLQLAWRHCPGHELDLSPLAHAHGLQRLQLHGKGATGLGQALEGALRGSLCELRTNLLSSHELSEAQGALPHMGALRSLALDCSVSKEAAAAVAGMGQLRELSVLRAYLRRVTEVLTPPSSSDTSFVGGPGNGNNSSGGGSSSGGAVVSVALGPSLQRLWIEDLKHPYDSSERGITHLVQHSPWVTPHTHLAMCAHRPWTLMGEVPELRELGERPGGCSWWLPDAEGLGHTLIPASMVRPADDGSSGSGSSGTRCRSFRVSSSRGSAARSALGRLIGRGGGGGGGGSAGAASASAGGSDPEPPQLECEGVIAHSRRPWRRTRPLLTPATKVFVFCLWPKDMGSCTTLHKLIRLLQAGHLPSLQRVVVRGLRPWEGCWELPSQAWQECLLQLAAVAWGKQRAVLQVLPASWLHWGYCQWVVRELRALLPARHGRAVPACAVQLLTPTMCGEQGSSAGL